jgi:hypothetical protein
MSMKSILKFTITVMLSIAFLPGCNSSAPVPRIEGAKSTPQEKKLEIGEWSIQEPEISPIDETKKQMLSTGTAGSKLVLCFKNGKLCSGNEVGVFVTSPCWVDGGEERYTEYERRVRLRFDKDKFLVETWGISDGHRGIFPRSPKSFVSSLMKHESLALEFGCDRADPGTVVVFDIHGLDAALKTAGLKVDLTRQGQ